MVLSTINFKPTQVFASKNSCIILSDKGQTFSCGRNWGGADQTEFTHLPLPQNWFKQERKCLKIASAAKRRFALCTDKTVYYTGSKSRQLSLPEDANKDKWTEFKLSKEETFDDKQIVDIACGNHYTLFVTTKGNLYAMGQQFWDKYF